MGCQLCLWIWWQLQLWCQCLLPHDLAQAALHSCDGALILYPYTRSSVSWNPFQVRNKRVCWPQCVTDFFFFLCLESTAKCILFGKLAFGEGMNIKTVFASAPERSVSERASSWQCFPFAKWITSPVTPNCHVRSFCKWLSLLAVPFGQWFLSL